MQTLLIQASAGVTERRAVSGNYIRNVQSEGVVYVALDGGPLFELPQGIGIKVPGGFEFYSVLSATTQTIKISTHHGDIDDNRLSVDSVVQTLDRRFYQTEQGEAFEGSIWLLAIAAQYRAGMIWNPAGSGKLIAISQVSLSTGSAAGTRVCVATSATNAAPWAVWGGAVPTPKLAGGAACSSVLYTHANAAFPTVSEMRNHLMPQNFPHTWDFGWPVLLGEGFGFVIASKVVNTDIMCNFEIREYAA